MRHRARCRRASADGWRVRARVERFSEPSVLLELRAGPAHGYELLEKLGERLHGERVDMGNLYRALRSMEEDGLVSSEWDESAPGPAKRVYRLTEAGATLLREWSGALRRVREGIDDFLRRYEEGGDHVPRP
jgi:PadR family transcriptional regulator, regulatory protein PadR